MTTTVISATAPDAVTRARRSLEQGGVVLLPTDTVYGLAALPSDERALERLFRIKRRPRAHHLPFLIADAGQLAGLGAVVTTAARRLMAPPYMPGPLTVALAVDRERRPPWLEERDEVAVRMPDDPFMLALLAATGPLAATSANLHAAGTDRTVARILLQLAAAPDLAVDGGPRETVPSTVVNCAVDPPRVEREGVVPAASIRERLA